MKQYYYLNNNQQVGPFSLEQFRSQPIGPDTLVWTNGMANWTRMADVPELRDLLNAGDQAAVNPQPAYNAPPQQTYTQSGHAYTAPTGMMPKTWLVESILVTFFCCIPLGIVGIVNASRVESRYRMGDSYGAQQASAEAARWTRIGFFVGLGLIALYFLYMLLVFGSIFTGFAGSGRRYY